MDSSSQSDKDTAGIVPPVAGQSTVHGPQAQDQPVSVTAAVTNNNAVNAVGTTGFASSTDTCYHHGMGGGSGGGGGTIDLAMYETPPASRRESFSLPSSMDVPHQGQQQQQQLPSILEPATSTTTGLMTWSDVLNGPSSTHRQTQLQPQQTITAQPHTPVTTTMPTNSDIQIQQQSYPNPKRLHLAYQPGDNQQVLQQQSQAGCPVDPALLQQSIMNQDPSADIWNPDNANSMAGTFQFAADGQITMPNRYSSPTSLTDDFDHDDTTSYDDGPLYLNWNMVMDGNGETILAQEMAKLSVNEREKVTQDIHGVSEEVVHETKEFVQQKLTELHGRLIELCTSSSRSSILLNNNEQHELSVPTNISTRNNVTASTGSATTINFETDTDNSSNNSNSHNHSHNVDPSAYLLALSIDEGYTVNRKLRLLFLRSCDFDIDRTADRMLKHFEKKLELFGPDKLCRTITQDDLDLNDRECLISGQSQLLPYRDVSGRAVFFQALSHYRYREVKNAMRVVYYILMSALEDEETQKKGVVCVVYNVEPRSELANDPQIYLNVYKLLPSIPLKMMGAHYCVKDAHLRQFMSSIRVAMSREVRLRSRVHHGSHQECIYALLTFGLPRRGFPIGASNGDLYSDKHREFLEMRRRQEIAKVAGTLKDTIIVPTNVDVLFGRGRPQQQNPGNVRCNYFVVASMDEYERASRNNKTVIAKQVIEKIKGLGGRFLRASDGMWEVVDDTEALKKISHSFRTHRQLIKEQKGSEIGTDAGNHEKRPRPS